MSKNVVVNGNGVNVSATDNRNYNDMYPVNEIEKIISDRVWGLIGYNSNNKCSMERELLTEIDNTANYTLLASNIRSYRDTSSISYLLPKQEVSSKKGMYYTSQDVNFRYAIVTCAYTDEDNLRKDVSDKLMEISVISGLPYLDKTSGVYKEGVGILFSVRPNPLQSRSNVPSNYNARRGESISLIQSAIDGGAPLAIVNILRDAARKNGISLVDTDFTSLPTS